MTNLLNVLKTMETETTGVKNDVINYLLDNSDNSEDLQTHLEDINNYGCESGQVNHLIYYTDTVAYYEEHESEIMEMLGQLGIVYVESENGIERLTEIFSQLDSADDRHDEAEETAIQGYADNVAMYEVNPFELNTQDKNYLAWAIFEYSASVLLDELDEMELIK